MLYVKRGAFESTKYDLGKTKYLLLRDIHKIYKNITFWTKKK